MQQFLHISVTQRKAVVQPDRVLDDCHRETVAVGLGVGHGQSAYPDPVKANAGKLRPTNRSSAYRCHLLDHQRKLEVKVSRWSGGWSRAVANSAVPRSFLHLEFVSTLLQRLNLLALALIGSG